MGQKEVFFMAYFSLYKWFSSYRKKPFENWIYYYSEYVLKTPEQREQERVERKRRVSTTLAQMGIISAMVHSMSDY